MADRLTVHDGETPVYDIVFRRDFGGFGEELEKLGFGRKKICIVSDSTVARSEERRVGKECRG